jgi:hypothetical protein
MEQLSTSMGLFPTSCILGEDGEYYLFTPWGYLPLGSIYNFNYCDYVVTAGGLIPVADYPQYKVDSEQMIEEPQYDIHSEQEGEEPVVLCLECNSSDSVADEQEVIELVVQMCGNCNYFGHRANSGKCCNRCHQHGHTLRECQVCTNCDTPCQNWRECPIVLKNTECFNCRRYGHFIEDCTRCKYCKKDGHVLEDCVRLKNDNRIASIKDSTLADSVVVISGPKKSQSLMKKEKK